MNEPVAAMLEAQDVSYAYPGGIEALTEVTFRAGPGEFVAVMGSNGSGKTTLLKVLMRLLRPSRGSVRLAGQDIARLRPAELYRRMGMVFQNPADQLFAPCVEEDVAFGPKNLGLDAIEVAARVDEALRAVEAESLRRRPVHHLSFGEQKRVCLAGVLAMQPDVLVLDEPTAGLDPTSESHMVDLLLRLHRERKTTIVLSTHSVDLLPVLADRVYVLGKGRVEREGPPGELLTNPALVAQAGLRLPLVAQLFQGLRRDGLMTGSLPWTLDQGRRQILQWLDRPDGEGGRS